MGKCFLDSLLKVYQQALHTSSLLMTKVCHFPRRLQAWPCSKNYVVVRFWVRERVGEAHLLGLIALRVLIWERASMSLTSCIMNTYCLAVLLV